MRRARKDSAHGRNEGQAGVFAKKDTDGGEDGGTYPPEEDAGVGQGGQKGHETQGVAGKISMDLSNQHGGCLSLPAQEGRGRPPEGGGGENK